MKVCFFDTHSFERTAFEKENTSFGLELQFLETKLNSSSAPFAKGSDVVCAFVNDKLDAQCLRVLNDIGIKMIALRSAGFNHVDLKVATELGMQVARVPGYSPHAISEFALGLLLSLNRKIHKSYNRVRDLNFSLDGLVGFDLHGKTVGVIGTGRIGLLFAKSVEALGCKVLAYDKFPSKEFTYVELPELLRKSDVISLHIPLTPETHYMINDENISLMKDNVYILNTSRGGLIDTKALIRGLKKQKIGGVALDVYEEEEEFFFKDLSGTGIPDDVLARLLTFPNVLISSHQAFLTHEALGNIAKTTLENIDEFRKTGTVLKNRV